MKGNIEFDLSDPQDARKMQEVLMQEDFQIALWDIMQMFRRVIKYEGFMRQDYLTEEEDAVVEKLQKEFFEILEDHGIRRLIEEQP